MEQTWNVPRGDSKESIQAVSQANSRGRPIVKRCPEFNLRIQRLAEACLCKATLSGSHGVNMRRLSILRKFGFVAVVLSGCTSSPSLENAQRTVAPQQSASSQEEEYFDACVISETGADRNGVRLPKEAVRAIRFELERRQVDCNAYANPTIASGRTQSPAQAPTPSLSFQE